jgi:hypothetical protein
MFILNIVLLFVSDSVVRSHWHVGRADVVVKSARCPAETSSRNLALEREDDFSANHILIVASITLISASMVVMTRRIMHAALCWWPPCWCRGNVCTLQSDFMRGAGAGVYRAISTLIILP